MFCWSNQSPQSNPFNAQFVYYQFDRTNPKTHQKELVQIKHFPHNKYDQYVDWRSTKVLSQDFNEIMETINRSERNFIDGSFPHDDSSLGFKYERKVTWVRLQTLIEDPVYYSSESLASLTRFQCSNKALEMAICILADCQPNLLKNHMLHTLNFEGVYQYCFLKDGVIRNVIIDDYIPCYEKKPVFCNPYNFTQTFAMLIEKALAKAFGSYKDIPDNPINLLEVIGCTPVAIHRTPVKHSRKQQYHKFLSTVCNTPKKFRLLSNSEPIVRDYGLHPSQTYKILSTLTVQVDGKDVDLVEISHQNDLSGWNGNFSQYSDIWKKVDAATKNTIFAKITFNQSFVMAVQQLSTFFRCAFAIENLSEQSVDWLQNRADAHHSTYCEFHIEHACEIYFRLQTAEECRQVFVLIQQTPNLTYNYIKGRMSEFTTITSFSDDLKPGRYILLIKTEWKFDDQKPVTVFISSRQHIHLVESSKKLHPGLLQKTLTEIIQGLPKNEFKTAMLGVTYLTKVMYRECGYAMLWVANILKDNVRIEYDERSLSQQGFKIRKPYSAKETIIVKSGESILISLKVLNRLNTEQVRFPSYDFRFFEPGAS